MNQTQHDLLLHCLGLKTRKSANRNCVASGPGEDTFADVEHLEASGMMFRGAKIPGGLVYYHATDAGCAAAKLTFLEYEGLAIAIENRTMRMMEQDGDEETALEEEKPEYIDPVGLGAESFDEADDNFIADDPEE